MYSSHTTARVEHLKIRVVGIVACAFSFCLPAIGDWRVSLPEGGTGRDITPANKYGVAVVYSSTSVTDGVAWYSPSGQLLLNYRGDPSRPFHQHDAEWIYILNDRQLLLVYDSGDLLRLLTLTGDNVFTETEYTFSPGQRANVYLKDLIEGDLTGFYYIDESAKTLSRVDFPAPPVSTSGATVVIQAAPTVQGPWAPVEERPIPTSAAQDYFRLKIRR